jgi:predicted nucleic acid-binding Zn ribbon protein
VRFAGDDPIPLSEALAAVGAELGLPPGNPMHELEQHWDDVVGHDVAAHARLDAVRDGHVIITVDGPIWATQLRYLETEIVTRATSVVGPGVVNAVKVRVAGGEPPSARRR